MRLMTGFVDVGMIDLRGDDMVHVAMIDDSKNINWFVAETEDLLEKEMAKYLRFIWKELCDDELPEDDDIIEVVRDEIDMVYIWTGETAVVSDSLGTDEKAKKFMQELFRTVNSCGLNEKKIAKVVAHEFVHEHRTLQQGVLRLLKECILEIARYHKSSRCTTDARNEDGIKWLKKIAEESEDAYMPFV